MAQFNTSPQPTQDPNYLNYSRGISQPASPQAASEAIKGIGETITTGISGADTAVKKTIENQIFESVNTERQQYTQALNIADATVRNGGKLTGVTPSPDGTTISAGDPEMPDDLRNLPGAVAGIQNARANGKLPETYYYGRLDSVVKDYRDRYPGYRDYIDQQVSSITGVNPANAYIKSVLGDINSFVTSKNASNNKIEAEALKFIGAPGIEPLRQAWKAGKVTDNQLMTAVSQAAAVKYNFDMRAQQRADFTGSREMMGEIAENEANQRAASMVSMTLDNALKAAGHTPESMNQLVEDVRNGKKTPEELQAAASAMAITQAQVMNRLKADFNRIDPTTQRSLVNDLGKDGDTKANRIIENQAKVFEMYNKGIVDKDLGPATLVSRMNSAKLDTVTNRMLNNTEVGPFIQTVAVLSKMSPNYTAGIIQASVDPKFRTGWNNWFTNFAVNTAAGNTTNGPATMADALKDVSTLAVDSNGKLTEEGKNVIKKVTDNPMNIVNAKASDAVKINIANLTFGPGNEGILGKFDKETTDAYGRAIPGQMNIFQKWTTPEITSELKRLGEKDPNVWNNYSNWVKTTFAHDIFLRDINDIDMRTRDANNPSPAGAMPPGAKITWDSDNHRFGVDYKGRTNVNLSPMVGMAGDYNTSAVNNLGVAINRLNNGLSSVSNVAKAEGSDVNAYIANILSDPKTRYPGSMGDVIMKSVAAANNKPKAKP